RALSSVGRALCSHRRGHWFESSSAHQEHSVPRGGFSVNQVPPDARCFLTIRRRVCRDSLSLPERYLSSCSSGCCAARAPQWPPWLEPEVRLHSKMAPRWSFSTTVPLSELSEAVAWKPIYGPKLEKCCTQEKPGSFTSIWPGTMKMTRGWFAAARWMS